MECYRMEVRSATLLVSSPQSMQSQAKMASAMGSTAKAMAATNKQLKVEDIQKTMMNFERESTKMDMAGEMSKSITSSQILSGSYYLAK